MGDMPSFSPQAFMLSGMDALLDDSENTCSMVGAYFLRKIKGFIAGIVVMFCFVMLKIAGTQRLLYIIPDLDLKLNDIYPFYLYDVKINHGLYCRGQEITY